MVSHAFASTEAGVGFAVDDGEAGFPAGFVGTVAGVDVCVADGSLRLRSRGTALRYLGGSAAIADGDGFVDTGDAVERRGNRYHFLGRKKGVINVGGLKVYPEEVEAAINTHPAVRMSLVRGKNSPITGALVTADVVLNGTSEASQPIPALKGEILRICRESLAPHKVPATLRFVAELDFAAAGKLART
jgi:acyl-coenzyme A synthetase/AMP-(fatty) acid ligase